MPDIIKVNVGGWDVEWGVYEACSDLKEKIFPNEVGITKWRVTPQGVITQDFDTYIHCPFCGKKIIVQPVLSEQEQDYEVKEILLKWKIENHIGEGSYKDVLRHMYNTAMSGRNEKKE